jgi:hypothetical protein
MKQRKNNINKSKRWEEVVINAYQIKENGWAFINKKQEEDFYYSKTSPLLKKNVSLNEV